MANNCNRLIDRFDRGMYEIIKKQKKVEYPVWVFIVICISNTVNKTGSQALTLHSHTP